MELVSTINCIDNVGEIGRPNMAQAQLRRYWSFNMTVQTGCFADYVTEMKSVQLCSGNDLDVTGASVAALLRQT